MMFRVGDRVHHRTVEPQDVGVIMCYAGNGKWGVNWLTGPFPNSTDEERSLVLAVEEYSPTQIGDTDDDV